MDLGLYSVYTKAKFWAPRSGRDQVLMAEIGVGKTPSYIAIMYPSVGAAFCNLPNDAGCVEVWDRMGSNSFQVEVCPNIPERSASMTKGFRISKLQHRNDHELGMDQVKNSI